MAVTYEGSITICALISASDIAHCYSTVINDPLTKLSFIVRVAVTGVAFCFIDARTILTSIVVTIPLSAILTSIRIITLTLIVIKEVLTHTITTGDSLTIVNVYGTVLSSVACCTVTGVGVECYFTALSSILTRTGVTGI